MLAVALLSFGAGYTIAGDDPMSLFGSDEASEGSDAIVEAYGRILSDSLEPPTPQELRDGALRGMCRVQMKKDPYTRCYAPERDEDVREVTQGRFSGIGVSLRLAEDGLLVVRVMPMSPAKEVGVRPGDVIVSVEGRRIRPATAQSSIDRIKGMPGTRVAISVRRGERELDFTIKRESLVLPQVTARMTKGGNAYLGVFGFARGTTTQARSELERLLDRGADGVILDLRNNPGGLLREAIDLSSLFIEDGDVVITREAEGSETTHPAKGDAYEDVPVVVLVNRASASASEIVAGALQDNDRAKVVGTRTFGKGTVQDLENLPDGSILKFTVASYLTPDGRDIENKGITPDVVVVDPRAQQRKAERLLEQEISAGAQG